MNGFELIGNQLKSMQKIISFAYCGLLIPPESCLNGTACLRIVADHVHPFTTTEQPSLDGCFQQDGALCYSLDHHVLHSHQIAFQ